MSSAFYPWIYARLIYPCYHGLLRDGVIGATRELAAHDALAPEELGRVQSRKLGLLLRSAAENVPYYRRQIRETGLDPATSDPRQLLASLPPLTKAIINREKPELVSRKLDGNRLDANSTSGSTGEPLRFFTDRRSKAYRRAAVTRNRRWLGIRPGDRVASLWGSPIDSRQARRVRGRLHAMVAQEKLLSAYALSDADMRRYATILERYRPRMLVGYPSVLVEFGSFCAGDSIRLESLKAIVCSAEALYPHQRKAIEAHFGVRVFNRYGCREVGDIGHEVPGSDGMLVNSDRVLVEIVDADGSPCAPGELGDLLVTDLDNFGMPLIRYAIGDLAAWGASPGSEAALPYPVLSSIEGRSLDVVRTPAGNRIGGTFWTILFREKPGMKQFQVVQRDPGGILVRYVQDPTADAVDLEYFAARIGEYCGAGFAVEFRRVEAIQPEETGKYRIVVGLQATGTAGAT